MRYFFDFFARGFLVFCFFSLSAMIVTFVIILILTDIPWSWIFNFIGIFKFYDSRQVVQICAILIVKNKLKSHPK